MSIIRNLLPCSKMRFRSIAPLLLLPLVASANPDDRVVSGYYTVGWEEQSFRPCGGNEGPWWVSNPGPMMVNYRDLVENEWGTIFVTVRADLTDPGRFGHLGGYRRSMAVLEVHDARLPSRERDDCSRVRDTE
jgi:hypothetical protein